jgi:hypothetical protein
MRKAEAAHDSATNVSASFFKKEALALSRHRLIRQGDST